LTPPWLILFDVDGTLVNTAGAGRVAIEQAFQRVFGIDSIASKGRQVKFAGLSDPVIFRGLARTVGLDLDALNSRRDELERAYLVALDAEMRRPDPRRRALPGVRPLLETLQGLGHAHLGLLTGNIEPGARRKLEPFDLNRFFPGGGYGSDHADRREIARHARHELARLTGLDFPSERVVVVGDTENDVDCARANGFRAIAVDTGFATREGLEASRPDALLPDLTDQARVLAAFGL